MGEYAELSLSYEMDRCLNTSYINDSELYNLKQNKIDYNYWTTIDGRKLLVSEMETNHIKNCIKHIEKRGGYNPRLVEEYEKRIKREEELFKQLGI